MRISSKLAIPLVGLALWGAPAVAQEYEAGLAGEVRIWLDRGESPVLQRGERVRVFYRTAQDAHVAIFQIDTDGAVRLLHPRGPTDETYTRGGRDYRLLFPQSPYWRVDEYPGKGYYFAVASPVPFDLSRIDFAYDARGWDLTRVGRTVYRDPYLAMDDYVAKLIPDWETVPYALDFISYDVGEVHDYPRFLCYDCHGFRSYPTWNPYTYACASVRVVVWDDPYFYPRYRYGSVGVVYTPPRRGVVGFEFKERARGETWSPLVRSREEPARRSTEYVEPGAVRAPQPSATPLRRSGSSPVAPRTAVPSGTRASDDARPASGQNRPVLQRRPSGAVVEPPDRGSPGAVRPPRSEPATAKPATGSPRVVPPSVGGGTPTRPSARAPVSSGAPRVTTPARGSGTSRTTVAPRPSGTSRPTVAPRPSGTSRPTVAPRPSGSSRPTVAPRPSGSSRPSASARPSAPPARSAAPRPAPTRTTKPPPRKPGG